MTKNEIHDNDQHTTLNHYSQNRLFLPPWFVILAFCPGASGEPSRRVKFKRGGGRLKRGQGRCDETGIGRSMFRKPRPEQSVATHPGRCRWGKEADEVKGRGRY